MSRSSPSPSIVEYFAEHEKYKCGYCKSPDTNFSHGMWAHTLTVQDYQDLIDRGWRRSGKYCYKPTMDQTCCPMYTIKCEALDFKISKSQKKILKRMSKFLRGELKRHDDADCDESIHEDGDYSSMDVLNCMEPVEKVQRNVTDIDISLVTGTLQTRILSPQNSNKYVSENPDGDSSVSAIKHDRNLTPASITSKEYKIGTGLDQSKPPLKKAKLMRLERKQSKLLSMGKSLEEVSNILTYGKSINMGKTLEELFNEENTEQHKLELRLVRTSPMSSEYTKTSKASYELYKKYQMVIHRDPAEKLTEDQYVKFLVKSPLQVVHDYNYFMNSKIKHARLEQSVPGLTSLQSLGSRFTSDLAEKKNKLFYSLSTRMNLDSRRLLSNLLLKVIRVGSEEFLDTFEAIAELYKKYQMAIHKDPPEECDVESFTNFLGKSPLQHWMPVDGPPQGYGSFHQQYWLNDKLIAVGVIDILPSCVSSVYFFYDPIYSYFSLGTYGSLQEVMLTRQLNKIVPSLKYYYMGFYIHNCLKMRYKAKMRPSKLLCPETYVWCDIEKCIPKLDKEKYSRLNEDIDTIDDNFSTDLSQVSILYKHTPMPYYIYKMRAPQAADEDQIMEYTSLVGIRCAQKLLLYRN